MPNLIKFKTVILFFSLCCVVTTLRVHLSSADELAALLPWTMNEEYQGPHQQSFQKIRYEIPILMRQTMIDMAVKLGLRFEEGWRHPLTVGFVDGAPFGAENVLAYVQLGRSENGFFQLLNINLQAYEADSFDYKKVFAHELIHAMLNDALGGQAALKIPIWLHEGLAVYGADQGEKMLKNYVYATTGFSESQLINGLEQHSSALDYAENYLAIKYLAVKKGPNCLHGFVRETIKKEGDYKAALLYACNESWENFQRNVTSYSKEEISNIGHAKFGYDEKPY